MWAAFLSVSCLLAIVQAEGFGNVTFSTSCNEVQSEFNSAVAVLHSFWYSKAREIFLDVLQKDPNCAVAYWGVAMSYWHPLWYLPPSDDQAAALMAVKKGRQLSAGATKREQDYIDAIGTFWEQWQATQNYTTGVLMYADKMEQIYYNYQQEDTEAMVFYPLALIATCTVLECKYIGNSVWPNYLPVRRGGKILETVQVYQPYHPGALHYTIHSYDFADLCDLGLHAALLYANAAPDVAHALHMPSHIFCRVGMWKSEAVSNIESMASADRWNPVPGTHDGDFTHALTFGTYGQMQMAEDACVRNYIEQAKTWKITDGGAGLANFQCRYYIESEDWLGASRMILYPLNGYDWKNDYWSYIFSLLYTQGMGFAKLGDQTNLTVTVCKMEYALGTFMNGTDGRWSDFTEQVNEIIILKNTLLAFQKWLSGDRSGALHDFEQVAAFENNETSIEAPLKVSAELTGQMFMEAGQPQRAIAWFNESQKYRRNRFHTLFGLGSAYATLGDTKMAVKYYLDFLNLCSDHTPGCTCSNRPQFTIAKNFIKAHQELSN